NSCPAVRVAGAAHLQLVCADRCWRAERGSMSSSRFEKRRFACAIAIVAAVVVGAASTASAQPADADPGAADGGPAALPPQPAGQSLDDAGAATPPSPTDVPLQPPEPPKEPKDPKSDAKEKEGKD